MRCRSGDRCPREALPEERFCAFHIGPLLWVRFELQREREERAPRYEQRRPAGVKQAAAQRSRAKA